MKKIPIDLSEHLNLPLPETEKKIRSLISLIETYADLLVEQAMKIGIGEINRELYEEVKRFVNEKFLFPEETAILETVMLLGREVVEETMTEKSPPFLFQMYKRFYNFAIEGAKHYGPGEIKYVVEKLPQLGNYLRMGLRAVKTLQNYIEHAQTQAWQQTITAVKKKIKEKEE